MNRMTSLAPAPESEATAADAAGPGAAADSARGPGARGRRLAWMLAVPLAILGLGLYLWLAGGRSVSTDNAYVKQDIVAISAQVSGPVAEVFVAENQAVKAGQPLYRIDPSLFEVAVREAEAQLAAAELATTGLKVAAAGTGGDIRAAQANLATARRALGRQQALMKEGFTTRARVDEAANEVAKATGQLDDARARAANASAAIAPSGQPQVAAARARLAKARLDLAHTLVHTPVDGIVARSQRLLPGQTVVPGVAMLSIVRSAQGERAGGYVEANFKEGDLAKMAVGQRATVRLDAYPELELAGHVASIGAGTGSEFSVLPAQNANGNWVKVTQRVPVRIALDRPSPRPLITGLSATVEVDLAGRQGR